MKSVQGLLTDMKIVFFYNYLRSFIHKLAVPKTRDKDLFRRRFVLNILLLGSIALSLSAFISSGVGQLISLSQKITYGGIPPIFLLFLTLFYVLLYVLSRSGKSALAAYIFLVVYFFCATYTAYSWGVDVPQAVLIYALIIVMSSILINSRFAFLMTIIVAVTLTTLGYFQQEKIIAVNSLWKSNPANVRDSFVTVITLFVIAIVSWLSNRETEKSLKRARISETALRRERDLLEIKIEERTKELKRLQIEKVSQLYRFAEIGRLASGLFHDLVTPLAVISINLEKLEKERRQESIQDMKELLQRALKGAKYLETTVSAVRKQLQNQDLKNFFYIRKEIKQIIQILNHKAQEAAVKIVFHPSEDIKIYGNEIKFNQLISNLIINAIDAYDGISKDVKNRIVEVNLLKRNKSAVILIKDKGIGINPDNLKNIFQPFFTTKSAKKGIGIGLSISKEIVEKNFFGNLSVTSDVAGTVFTIILPLNNETEKNRKSNRVRD